MYSTIISLLIVFVGVPAFFLFVFIFLPVKLREHRLASIARNFGLVFDSNRKGKRWFMLSDASYKRNIMSGQLNGHAIAIADNYELIGGGKYSRFKRRTIITVDKETKERGSMTGFLSVSMIKRRLKDLQSPSII